METTVDQFARNLAIGSLVVAFCGLMVAILAYVLDLRRHRRERPTLRLLAEVQDPESTFANHPSIVTFTLINDGGADTQILDITYGTSTHQIVYTIGAGTPESGTSIVGLGRVGWEVEWIAFAPDERTAGFRATAEAVGAKPASARFTVRTHRLSHGFARQVGLVDEDLETT